MKEKLADMTWDDGAAIQSVMSLYRKLRRSAVFTLRELGLRGGHPSLRDYQAVVHAWK